MKVQRSLRRTILVTAFGAFACAATAQDIVVLNNPKISDELRDALTSASLLLAAEDEGNTDTQDLLAAARSDYGRLVGALYSRGYYGGTVSITADGREVATIPALASPTDVKAYRINVDPGPLFRFGTAQVQPIPPGTELPEDFRTGKRASSGLMRTAVNTAVDQWREIGHAKARAAGQSVSANHPKEQLDASFTIDPGPVVRFGDLIVSGNTRVRADRIRAIAGLPTGEIYKPEDIDNAARRLRETGAFRSAAVQEAETLGPGDTLDITAEISEAKKRRLGAGIEYSTTDGLTLSTFWIHRNLRGGAERLRFDAEVAGIGGDTGGLDYGLSARYSIPAIPSPDTNLFFFGDIARLDEPNYEADTAALGFGFERRFSDKLNGETSLGLLYSDVSDDFGQRDFFLLTAPTSLTYDNRDDSLNATAGYYIGAEITPFAGLDESESGVRTYLDGRAYRSVGLDSRVVLAGRLQFGSVAGSTLDGTLPEYLFYSGGGGTVRGQDYQSLGVDLGNGDTSGGRSFFGASAEVRATVRGNIGLVGFFDTGYVGEDSLPGENGEWQSGAGIGLRYATGIGPIRLDVAAPVGGDSDGIQIYLGIGQAF